MRKQKRVKRTKRARGGGPAIEALKAQLAQQKVNTTKVPNYFNPVKTAQKRLSLNNLRSRITNKSKLINYKGIRGTYGSCSSGAAPIDGKCPDSNTTRISNGTTITNFNASAAATAPAAGGRR